MTVATSSPSRLNPDSSSDSLLQHIFPMAARSSASPRAQRNGIGDDGCLVGRRRRRRGGFLLVPTTAGDWYGDPKGTLLGSLALKAVQ
jgi:hypothetical protein